MANKFQASRAAEIAFNRQLRKVAKASGHIVEAHVEGHKIKNPHEMMTALRSYAKTIGPWAERQAAKVLNQINLANKRAFKAQSKTMGRLIKRDVAESTTGAIAYALMNEQVQLIKSIPLKAGERAQQLAFTAVTEGTRASEVAMELQRSTKVSESDATRIARTEVARANAYISQARAEAVGSTQYRWRNAGDAAVREAHKYYHGQKIDGRVFDWKSPPTLDDGTTGHPGTFPNCRCYAEPVFD